MALILQLKQGHMWRTGFESNQLKGVVYEDVPDALHKWQAKGIKVKRARSLSLKQHIFHNHH